MHHLTLTEGIENNRAGLQMKPGTWLVEDVSGAQMLAMAGGGKMEPVEPFDYPTFSEREKWNGKSILLVMTAGFTKLILLTPVLREIARRWPTAKITVATVYMYRTVLKDLPYVHEVIEYPIKKTVAASFDAVVFFEKELETNPLAKKLHATDLFASIAGLTGKFDRKPEYRVSSQEVMWALEGFPRTPGVQRAVLHLASGDTCREYHPDQISAVMVSLLEKKWEVFIVGEPNSVQIPNGKGIRNLTMEGLTFRHSCAIVNGSDIVIGPDSVMVQIAGALDVPAIGLFGPFPADLRTKYSPSIFALQGKGSCAPCFHYEQRSRGMVFPAGGPCQKTGKCEVLAGIDPERVVQKAMKLARKFELKAL